MSVCLCVIDSLLEAHLLFACALVSSSYGIRRSFYSGLGAAVKIFPSGCFYGHFSSYVSATVFLFNTKLSAVDPALPTIKPWLIYNVFLFLSDVEATYLSLFQTACIVLRRIFILNCSYRSVVATSVGLTYCARSPWLHAYIHTRRATWVNTIMHPLNSALCLFRSSRLSCVLLATCFDPCLYNLK